MNGDEAWYSIHANAAGRYCDIGEVEGAQIAFPSGVMITWCQYYADRADKKKIWRLECECDKMKKENQNFWR